MYIYTILLCCRIRFKFRRTRIDAVKAIYCFRIFNCVIRPQTTTLTWYYIIYIILTIGNSSKNFKVGSLINKTDVEFFDIEDERFSVYGVFKEDGKYFPSAEDFEYVIAYSHNKNSLDEICIESIIPDNISKFSSSKFKKFPSFKR